jgi:hypothetical protein
MTPLLELLLGYPTAVASDMSIDQWAAVMAVVAPNIDAKRKASVPDDANFQMKVVDPSAVGYADTFTTIVPNPRTGKTQQMILDNQHYNLMDAFDNWNQKLDEAFKTVGAVPAKKFVDAVNAAKNLWGKGAGARTLRATGARATGVGASVIAPYWLTLHKKAASVIRVGTDQVILGAPMDIVVPGMENAFMTMLIGQITFSMIQAEKSQMNAAVLTSLNDRLNKLVQSAVDANIGLVMFATGADSCMDIVNDPILGEMLHVKVAMT